MTNPTGSVIKLQPCIDLLASRFAGDRADELPPRPPLSLKSDLERLVWVDPQSRPPPQMALLCRDVVEPQDNNWNTAF